MLRYLKCGVISISKANIEKKFGRRNWSLHKGGLLQDIIGPKFCKNFDICKIAIHVF